MLIWSTAAASGRCRKIFGELPSVLIRRSLEQLGSPAEFRRLSALAFGEILSIAESTAPAILWYRKVASEILSDISRSKLVRW
jgi:hypothetical protein